MRSILATPIVIAAVTVAAQVLPRPPAPDLILINGRVITVDRNFTVGEGVAIVGDRILVNTGGRHVQHVTARLRYVPGTRNHATAHVSTRFWIGSVSTLPRRVATVRWYTRASAWTLGWYPRIPRLSTASFDLPYRGAKC